MRFCNLHAHTVFSDGANTVQEMVAAAQEKNMLALGISDHSFTACDPSYCMKPEQYEEYIAAIREAGRSCAMPVYAGLELDAYSEDVSALFDYVIASVHYIIKDGVCHPVDHSLRQQQDCIRYAFGGSVLDMAKCYYDLLCEHVQRTRPTLLGHFDVITKFSIMPESDDRYRQIAEDALKQILRLCPYIELNTGAIARGLRTAPYPSDYMLEVVREEGGSIVLSADAHRAENQTFWFDEAVALLKQKGIDHIAVFNGKGFESVQI